MKIFENVCSGDLSIAQTDIKWKPGMNLCDPGDVAKMLSGKQAGKKRPHGNMIYAHTQACMHAACMHTYIHAYILYGKVVFW